jgi:hypothetical protein
VRIKAGDLLPPLVIDLTDNDLPLNITTATGVSVIGTQGTTTVFTDNAPTRDNANGIVTHTWVAPQTATPGRMWVEVVVTWPTAKPQTFPALGQLAVDIEP